MTAAPDILCIGAVLWDVIGRAPDPMGAGSDVPGRITRVPGGVALNIAMTLRRFGLRPAVLGAIGTDAEGHELAAALEAMGLSTRYLYRSHDLPTDRYMAIEGAGGLIAAIADAHSLEAAGAHVLTPLLDGALGGPDAPFAGVIALDGNLTEPLLQRIVRDPAFARADLRVAPASPGKAGRLLPLMEHPEATLYLNREEAELMCLARFDSAAAAAETLVRRGAHRVLVTDGAQPAASGSAAGLVTRAPPPVRVSRITGAGDTFMAAHIAAELAGHGPEPALEAALQAAARYVAGESHP